MCDKKPTFNFLILQTTKDCNLRCSYCYIDPNIKYDLTRISPEFVKKIFEDMARYYDRNGISEPISVVFHGGEPMMLGHQFYEMVLPYAKVLNDVSPEVRVTMQSNLTLLDQKYCDIFIENNVYSIGTSIDGPAYLHNIHRCNSRRDNIHGKVMKNLELARKNGINVGAICIITRDSLTHAKEIYDFFFENKLDFKTNSITINGRASMNRVEISSREYVTFLKELFDIWFFDERASLKIENLYQFMALVLKGEGYGSCANENCTLRHLAVVPNGDCFTCNRSTQSSEFLLGNLKSGDFFDLAQSSRLSTQLSRISENIPQCMECDLRHICHSGCMHEAFLEHGSIFAADGKCMEFRDMYRHVQSRIMESLSDEE
jgi:uncharacterized protein